jgi:hypothetical protein
VSPIACGGYNKPDQSVYLLELPATMPTSQQTPRRYHVACRRCQRSWDALYEVVTYHDLNGVRERLFLQPVAATPPSAGLGCPRCGGVRLTIVPARAIRPPRPQPPPAADADLRGRRQEG